MCGSLFSASEAMKSPFFLRMGMLGPAEETGFPLGTMFAVAT